MRRKPSTPIAIDTLDELHRCLPELVKLQETHPRLAIAALANPLLAIEQAGYTLAPTIAREAELRVRFRPEDADKLLSLERSLHSVLGQEVDLESPDSFIEPVLRVIAERPAKGKRAGPRKESGPDDQDLRAALERPLSRRPGRPLEDPLEAHAARHPLLAEFVEYRRLEFSRPRLASRDLFEALLTGNVQSPISKARFTYKARPARGSAGRRRSS
jgi:hypothetical protein